MNSTRIGFVTLIKFDFVESTAQPAHWNDVDDTQKWATFPLQAFP